MVNPTLQTSTSNGITCTNNGDGTYTLTGMANKTTSFWIDKDISLEKGKTYKIIGSTAYCSVGVIEHNYSEYTFDQGKGGIITPTKNSYMIRVDIPGGVTVNGTIKPMLTTNLNATYDDFVPYTGGTGHINSDLAALLKRVEALETK